MNNLKLLRIFYILFLPFLLLLSGFAGISYEILYGRLLGNLIGDQFAVSASVLITFLLGAGLGSAYAHRLSPWLWLIELGIGLFGILFALGNQALESFIYAHGLFAQGLAGKILVCSILLIAPAFLVGCSVPLFSAYLSRESNTVHFARVYAIYNFGAALTALGLEFVLIRLIGINHTLWSFALVNFAIAAALRLYFPALGLVPPASQTSSCAIGFSPRLALILASIASAIFQLYMLKLAELFFGPFRENFALVLAIVLFGIAFGSALTKRLRLSFSALMACNVAGLALIFLVLEPIIHAYASIYQQTAEHHANLVALKMLVLAALMAIPAITFGATIPALLRDEGQVAKDSGHLLFISALANSLGFLLMAFLLHPYLDFGTQLLVVAGLSLAAWLVHERRRLASLIPATLALLFIFGLHQRLWDEDLLYLSYTSFHSVEEMERNRASLSKQESFKGNQDIYAINIVNGSPYFFINGYISFPLNSSSEKVVGLLSTLFSPRLDEALVLGLGSGSTASVVGLAFDHTDTVEINPLVRANLYKLKEWNFDMEHNPKVSFIVDDAIHYTRSTDKTYSLILNTVTSPLYFSSSKLYTEDFFKAVKKRLRPDGVYATWIDSRMGDRGFDIIIKTLSRNFSQCGLFYIKNTYFLLICGENPLAYHQTRLAERAPQAIEELLQKYNLLPEFLPYNLLTTRPFNLLGDDSVPVNRLDFPALENEMAGLAKKGLPQAKKRLAAQMSIEEIRQVLAPGKPDWNPANLAVEAEQVLEKSYITDRWGELAKQASADYGQAHDQAELYYYARRAEAAGTAKAFHKYGYQLLKRKRYPEAIELFNHTLELDPAYDNVNFNLGACYQYMGDKQKAAEYYLRELAIDPSDQEAVTRLVALGQGG